MAIVTAQVYKIAAILAELLKAGKSELLAAMKATGRGDLDHAGLVTLIEELSKTALSQKSSS